MKLWWLMILLHERSCAGRDMNMSFQKHYESTYFPMYAGHFDFFKEYLSSIEYIINKGVYFSPDGIHEQLYDGSPRFNTYLRLFRYRIRNIILIFIKKPVYVSLIYS
jgi:hypothetical protein